MMGIAMVLYVKDNFSVSLSHVLLAMDFSTLFLTFVVCLLHFREENDESKILVLRQFLLFLGGPNFRGISEIIIKSGSVTVNSVPTASDRTFMIISILQSSAPL